MGIHSINVAPEFGVVETNTLFNILKLHGYEDILEKIVSLSYNSKKWEKWMLNNTKATDFEKAMISGHYIFSNQEFKDYISFVKKDLFKKNISLNEKLKSSVKSSILRYISNLGMIN